MKKIAQRVYLDIKKYWGVTACIVIAYIVLRKLRGAFCPSVILFGLPCPGCGVTRAALYVLKGQFAEAFYINPAVYLWLVFLLYIIVVRYIMGKPLKHFMVFVTVIGILMIVRYAYGMYSYYPYRPPFAYTGGNVMEDVIPGYMHMVRDFQLPDWLKK